jgi:adenylate cyclase
MEILENLANSKGLGNIIPVKFFKKNSCLFFLSIICWIGVSAQSNDQWADSVLNFLETNEDLSYTAKKAQCASLLELFENNDQPCNRIKTLILQSYYDVVLGNEKQVLTGLNLAQSLLTRNDCEQFLLLTKLDLAYGNLYIHLNEPVKARQYLLKGVISSKPVAQSDKVLIELYMNLAATFAEKDSQFYYNNLALTLAFKYNELRLQEIIFNSIGCMYAELGEHEQAIRNFTKALEIARKRHAYSSVSALYNNLAGLTTNGKQTLRYIDSAIYYAQLKNSLEDLQTSYQNKSIYYYDNEDYKSAYDLFFESSLLKDSLYNRDKITAFADMEQKYESVKKEARISLLNELNENKTQQRNVLLIGGVVLLVFSYNVVRQRNNVKMEKKRSDMLLLNILPSEVAEELKSTGVSEAKLYNHVTVLFTDFVNFTGISQQMSPTELVQEIHKNFTVFDAIIEKHGLEKIKTIGDAYLAVCGLPNVKENHAQQVIKASLEIVEYMKQEGHKFEVRIGVNSGPVVAGIVGVKKYAYDIWGDTVNTAARMEQNSEAGKINISGATYELIKEDFNCEHRGMIQAKNKGEVDMYFVG